MTLLTQLPTIALILLMVKTTIQLYLNWRQKSYVLAHAKSVPNEFAEKITLEQHQKAAHYTAAKINLSFFALTLELVFTIYWLWGGGLAHWQSWSQGLGMSETLTQLSFFGAFIVVPFLPELALQIYQTFVLEAKFGFNRTTPKTFIIDQAKGLLLGLLLGLPLILGLMTIMESIEQWWFWGWIFLMGLQLLILWLYPVFIAPLFNKFTTLDHPEFKTKIEQLLQRTNFAHSGLYVMDASKRSSHGNAYFTGFGKAKRIVFFDTLLKGLNPNEVEAILAHELGHFKRKHIAKMLVMSSLLTLSGFWLMGQVATQPLFFQSFNLQPQTMALLLLFSLLLPLFTFFLSPLVNQLSRKHEFEADAFAAEHCGPESLISGLIKLYQENASTLTPDPWYSTYYHSHPVALARIAHLKSLQKTN